MNQSFPSVSGPHNLRLQTFGSASAIEADVYSHQLQRRASFNVGSDDLLLVGLPRPFSQVVDDVTTSSFVAAILLRPPSNVAAGHIFSDDDCTHTTGGNSIPTPRSVCNVSWTWLPSVTPCTASKSRVSNIGSTTISHG